MKQIIYLFQKSLNMNYQSYFKNKIKEMTYEEIKNLIMFLFIILIYKNVFMLLNFF